MDNDSSLSGDQINFSNKLPPEFVAISVMYGRNFKPKTFTYVTMPARLFVAQILAKYVNLSSSCHK